ncbi:MAG: hypothetical protein ACHQE6_08780 [Solirubrobacterales bacterium]
MRGAAALLLCALALGGCESSQEKSAQIEKQVKLAEARHPVSVARGLTIAHASTQVKVLATQILHDAEGTAAVVTLRNVSAHALRDVPIAITVRDAGGRVLFQNNAPGLEAALTSVPLLAPHAQFTWVDDQVQVTGTPPTSVSALVGEAPQAPASAPQIGVSGVHATEEAGGAGAAGTVRNGSTVPQRNLVVYGVARRGGRVVAAGRAVLPELAAHNSSPFQVLFIGSPTGARLEMSAPPTTF